jgi:hypothetical protein
MQVEKVWRLFQPPKQFATQLEQIREKSAPSENHHVYEETNA